jgi:VanZ family protein
MFATQVTVIACAMTTATQPRPSPHRIARILFLLAALAVSILSLLPQRDLPKVGVSDKLEHLLSYFVLAILGSLAFRGWRSLLFLFVLLCAMGGLIELLQAFSPGRSPDVVDALADGAGGAAGVLVGAALALLRRR